MYLRDWRIRAHQHWRKTGEEQVWTVEHIGLANRKRRSLRAGRQLVRCWGGGSVAARWARHHSDGSRGGIACQFGLVERRSHLRAGAGGAWSALLGRGGARADLR